MTGQGGEKGIPLHGNKKNISDNHIIINQSGRNYSGHQQRNEHSEELTRGGMISKNYHEMESMPALQSDQSGSHGSAVASPIGNENPWTEDEIAILYKGIAQKLSIQQLAAMIPNRSTDQIQKLKDKCVLPISSPSTNVVTSYNAAKTTAPGPDSLALLSSLAELHDSAVLDDNASSDTESTKSLSPKHGAKATPSGIRKAAPIPPALPARSTPSSNVRGHNQAPNMIKDKQQKRRRSSPGYEKNEPSKRVKAENSTDEIVRPPTIQMAIPAVQITPGGNHRSRAGPSSLPLQTGSIMANIPPQIQNRAMPANFLSVSVGISRPNSRSSGILQAASVIPNPHPGAFETARVLLKSSTPSRNLAPQRIIQDDVKKSHPLISTTPPISGLQQVVQATAIINHASGATRQDIYGGRITPPSLPSVLPQGQQQTHQYAQSPRNPLMEESASDGESDMSLEEIPTQAPSRGSKFGVATSSYLFRALENAKTVEFQKFCFYEFFYSAIDVLYFTHSEFWDCLTLLGIPEPCKMTRKEFKKMKLMLGKPRRFSSKFLDQEKQKLDFYRRVTLHIQNRVNQRNVQFGCQEGIGQLLPKGANITAFHSSTNFVHEGVVLGWVSPHYYLIKFVHEDLGVQKVPSTQVMSQYPLKSIPQFDLRAPSDSWHNTTNEVPSASDERFVRVRASFIDALKIAKLLQLLDKKQALIDHLQFINESFEQDPNTTELNDIVKYQVYWIIHQLELVNQELCNILYYVRVHNLLPGVSHPQNPTEQPASLGLKDYCMQEAHKLLDSQTNEEKLDDKGLRNLLLSSVALILMIKHSADQGLLPVDFISVIDSLRPKGSSNMILFDGIVDSIQRVIAGLTSL